MYGKIRKLSRTIKFRRYALGIDFHFGLPSEEEYTVSRLTAPTFSYKLKEILYDPRILYLLSVLNLRAPNSIVRKIRKTTTWMKMDTVILSHISFFFLEA